MTVYDHCTRRVQQGGKSARPIPTETAACMRCGGQIYWTDTVTDLISEHSGIWVCVDCLATGRLTLTMTLTDARSMGERIAGQWLEVG